MNPNQPVLCTKCNKSHCIPPSLSNQCLFCFTSIEPVIQKRIFPTTCKHKQPFGRESSPPAKYEEHQHPLEQGPWFVGMPCDMLFVRL